MKFRGKRPIDELVRAANPVDADGLPEPAQSASAQALYQRIVAGPADARAPLPRRHRYPRVRISLASLVAAAGVGAGVSYAINRGTGVQKATIACYASARLSASHYVFAATASDPVATCRQAWATGAIPGPVPAADQVLRACVLPAKKIGVFPAPAPSADPCALLHLRPVAGAPNVSTSAVTDPVVAMTGAVTQALAGGCRDQASAEAKVRQALDQNGLAGWTVEVVGPFSADRPCASPGFDEINHVVLIIPISRPNP